MLSTRKFLDICESVSIRIEAELESLIGTPYGAEELYIGADNTPTERLDKIAEDIVLKEFRENNLCASLLSEEAGLVEIGGEEGIAYLDPVDGSFNAGVGIPFYAFSVALSDGKKLIAGYVRNLANGETFTAEIGNGAYLNGKKIHPSNVSSLKNAAVSLYAHSPEQQYLLSKGYNSRRSRVLGALALEICYVACGRLDCFIDLRGNLRVTDAAAATLILEEAGGIVSLPDGNPYILSSNLCSGSCLLGTNKSIYNEVVNLFR